MKPGCWAIRVVLPGETSENALLRALDEPVLTLGRSSKTQVSLDDPAVSRRHATLTAVPDLSSAEGWRLTDLNSRNGTLVNGEATTETLLREGDVIAVGPYELTLGVLDASGSWPSASPSPARDAWSADDDAPVTVVSDQSANISRLTQLERPKVDAHQLRAVQALGHDLLNLEAQDARLQRLCAFMVEPVMRGQHAAVLQASQSESETGWSKPRMVMDPVSSDGVDQDFYISRSLLNAVARSGEAVMATRSGLEIDGGADDGAAIVELSITARTQLASVIGCPLPAVDGEAGSEGAADILYVVLPDHCGTGEWLALTALVVEQYELVERAWRARQAAEEQAKTQAMLTRARRVQLGLVPESPTVPGLELALHFEPCFSVGGDYLDVVNLPDGRALLLVMDVCGKGLAAALTSASLHTFVRARVDTSPDVCALMNALNRHLCDTTDDTTFVTGIAVALDPVTGEAECVNAGHPPALLCSSSTRPDGSSELRMSQHSENVPLGLLPEPLAAHRLSVEPGSVLALYSDGLTEIVAADGHWIGHQGLGAQLVDAVGEEPDASLDEVRDRLNHRLAEIQAGSPPDDDMTFLLARRA